MTTQRATGAWKKSRVLLTGVLACVAVACGAPPQSTTLPLPQTSVVSNQRLHSVPPRARRGALLYVSGAIPHGVAIYSYPDLRLQGELSGIGSPEGLCVNGRTGDVWVVDGPYTNKVIEFAHGETKPIRTLRFGSGEIIQDCAVNPANGDLAVGVLFGDDPGFLAVFKNGRGRAVTYTNRGMFGYYFTAYDNRGNAFVDGNSFKRVAELTSRAKRLVNVPLEGLRIRYPASMQYDGSYLAIGDGTNGAIYQTSGGMLAGTTRLQGTCSFPQFFIDGPKVIVANVCGSKREVAIYNYPAGGAPLRVLTGLSGASGVAISR